MKLFLPRWHINDTQKRIPSFAIDVSGSLTIPKIGRNQLTVRIKVYVITIARPAVASHTNKLKAAK